MPMAVRILTPDGPVYESDEATLVFAPGDAGDLGIEPNHTSLLTTLRIGMARVQLGAEQQEVPFAIHGGFLQVTPTQVLIVADAAEQAAHIDVARARAARQRAELRLKERAADIDDARAEAALRRALLRLRVAEHT